MTFDVITSYVDDNYDPYDYADYNDFINTIVQDWVSDSNNPEIIFRPDIQEGLNDLYESTFGLQEPESFEQLIREFPEPEPEPEPKPKPEPELTEPEIKSLSDRLDALIQKTTDLLKRFFK